MTPARGQVLVALESDEKVLPSGLVLPDIHSDESRGQNGRVVAVGPPRVHPKTGVELPPEVQVGDRVILKRFRGTELDIDGWPHAIIPEEHILAVISI